MYRVKSFIEVKIITIGESLDIIINFWQKATLS